MFNLKSLLPELMSLANTAGDAIMHYHTNGYNITCKNDGSPVSQADQASEDIIISGLNLLTPDIPVVAEEQAEAGNAPDVSDHKTFWLVDPLDGTKEFIKGTSKDFTVNIGLIHDGIPVFGLVYLPATSDLYYGGKNIGAFLNNKKIACAPYDNDGLILVGSNNHPNKESNSARKAFLKGHHVKSFTTRGSSLKFCMIASGEAHLYVRKVPTYEWDTAAAHAIAIEAGGDILDFQTGTRLAYGKIGTGYLNGNLITGTNKILKLLA